MKYKIELAHIPAGNLGTIVLAGCFLGRSSYGVKIGLVGLALPLAWTVAHVDSAREFQDFKQVYQEEQSIFDMGPAPSMSSFKPVMFSPSEEFANGTETIFTAFDLKTILRTILPHDGNVTVLQFMAARHGQAIGLTGYRAVDVYTSVVYEVIGTPLVEDKKIDA